MNYPPQRNSTQFFREWKLRQPYVYRYLKKRYVEEFFKEGTLRLSSFSEFAKHKDEARLDSQEGKGFVIHNHRIGDGQHIAGWLRYGEQSYVLCGAMRHDPEIMNAFDSDSAIRINDTVRFADCVAHHIPGFMGGAEGPCIYLPNRIVHRNLGLIDERVLHDEAQPGSVSIEKMHSFLSHIDSGDLCFIKHRDYAYQSEYRFLWDSRGPTCGSLTVKVPEAREFCTRLEDLEVELGDG
jgi:hypothetical protein